jgi:hypothetical protein
LFIMFSKSFIKYEASSLLLKINKFGFVDF